MVLCASHPLQHSYRPAARLDTVWEPVFGAGSRQVLESKVSHALPISDAGLGSFAYTFEFAMGFMGSPAGWRTMPWTTRGARLVGVGRERAV